MSNFEFDWAELAFSSKKQINELRAVFISAPRDISPERFTQLVKQYLPHSTIIVGLAKEYYVLGFEDQPQFCTLQAETIRSIVDKVNRSPSTHKIYTLRYFQREQKHLIDKLRFRHIVFVNGSWRYSFHMSETYYTLANKRLNYERVSPFADETEAREIEAKLMHDMHQKYDALLHPRKQLQEADMLTMARHAALFSFDHSYQTGVALGKKKKDSSYELFATSFNKVVPYQTYAWHHGPLRESHFSPPGDLNYYDTVHAEVEILIKANRERLDLAGTSIFINLLPCPNCSRMFGETHIQELIYSVDHSDGQAVGVLERAGKIVRRVIE